jgi:hypothetical protein
MRPQLSKQQTAAIGAKKLFALGNINLFYIKTIKSSLDAVVYLLRTPLTTLYKVKSKQTIKRPRECHSISFPDSNLPAVGNHDCALQTDNLISSCEATQRANNFVLIRSLTQCTRVCVCCSSRLTTRRKEKMQFFCLHLRLAAAR